MAGFPKRNRNILISVCIYNRLLDLLSIITDSTGLLRKNGVIALFIWRFYICLYHLRNIILSLSNNPIEFFIRAEERQATYMKKMAIITGLIATTILAGCGNKEIATNALGNKSDSNMEKFTDENMDLSFEYDANTFSVEQSEENKEDKAVYISCKLDPENETSNYFFIRFVDDMDADEYFETLRSLDSKYDNYFDQELSYFGYDGRDTKLTHYTINDEVVRNTTVFPYKGGAYVIEACGHIYGDEEEEKAMLVSDTMSELINSIEFPKDK